MASFRPRGAAVAGRKGGGPGMGAARRRRRVGPTDDWEQLELLCLWPEQRDYELIRPLVLFGSPAAERAGETGAASERTLQRRARRFGISTLRALRLFSRALHADQKIVAVGNVQRRRLRLRPRGHAHRLSNLLGGAAFAVSLGVAWLDLSSFEHYVWFSFAVVVSRRGAGLRSWLSSPLSSGARRSLPLRWQSTPSARRRSATWPLRRGSPCR